MLDKAIIEFLNDKKQNYLKNKITPNFSDEELLKTKQEADDKFALESWLIDSSKRAKQLSLTSHPAKFVHPNAKASSIIADAKKSNDGLLRSGNVKVDLDVFGNAAALDVEKFLRIKLQDEQTILQHLEKNTDTIKQQFDTKQTDFDSIRNAFLLIKSSDLKQSSEKLKQVYFPVDDDYHLLSILNASGIIYKLKQRINDCRFSEDNKSIKEALKKSKPDSFQSSITDIYNLSAVGYGGTKPQNISTINNQNGGVSLLLSSIPPQIEKRQTQPPKTNFFDECLWLGLFKQDFEQFHKVLSLRKNNKDIRDKRDDIVINSITKLKRLVSNIRAISLGWSNRDHYQNLPLWQKIWLDEQHKNTRNNKDLNHDYLTHAQTHFANWFIGHYKQSTKDNKLLGNDDIGHIKDILMHEKELLQ